MQCFPCKIISLNVSPSQGSCFFFCLCSMSLIVVLTLGSPLLMLYSFLYIIGMVLLLVWVNASIVTPSLHFIFFHQYVLSIFFISVSYINSPNFLQKTGCLILIYQSIHFLLYIIFLLDFSQCSFSSILSPQSLNAKILLNLNFLSSIYRIQTPQLCFIKPVFPCISYMHATINMKLQL